MSVLNHAVNHQNTQLNAETKNQTLEVQVVFTVSSFVGNPVECKKKLWAVIELKMLA